MVEKCKAHTDTHTHRRRQRVPVAVISWKIENGGFRGAGDRIGMLVGLGLGLTKPSQQSALWNAVFQALARTHKLCVCVGVYLCGGRFENQNLGGMVNYLRGFSGEL